MSNEQKTFREKVFTFAHWIAREKSPRAQADFRRLHENTIASFFFFSAIQEADVGQLSDAQLKKWQAAAGAIAIASINDNVSDTPLGEALARAGVSEMRLLTWLRCREETRFDAARGMARVLASKQEACRPEDIAYFVLLSEEAAETHRQQIASNYFSTSATLNKAEQR